MREIYITYLIILSVVPTTVVIEKALLALQLQIRLSYSGNLFFPGHSLSWHVDKISVIGDIWKCITCKNMGMLFNMLLITNHTVVETMKRPWYIPCSTLIYGLSFTNIVNYLLEEFYTWRTCSVSPRGISNININARFVWQDAQ